MYLSLFAQIALTNQSMLNTPEYIKFDQYLSRLELESHSCLGTELPEKNVQTKISSESVNFSKKISEKP